MRSISCDSKNLSEESYSIQYYTMNYWS